MYFQIENTSKKTPDYVILTFNPNLFSTPTLDEEKMRNMDAMPQENDYYFKKQC